jgi:glutamyl-tRNA reductase
VLPRRLGRHVAILDLAVPRDFDPAIADLEEVDLLLNVDDLNRIRDEVLRERLKHVPAAEALVQSETDAFLASWSRRSLGPAITRLCQEWERIRLGGAATVPEPAQRQVNTRRHGDYRGSFSLAAEQISSRSPERSA